MKVCHQCKLSFPDNANYCPQCNSQLQFIQAQPQPVVDPRDHTAFFDAKDISDNKIMAMLPYIMGWGGVIIALLASGTSAYTGFHVRQALKIQIITILSYVLGIIPFIGWIAVGVWGIIALVLNIIGFFNVCSGKAKEPAIISSFGFLK